MPFKSGFITIIGRPNTGKSTLLNALLGEKVSIVSDKPQTTRNVIKGVKNTKDCQMVFIDTPGLHDVKGSLNKFMKKEAVSALNNVDGIILLVDAAGRHSKDDIFVIELLKEVGSPVILGINKIDLVKKEVLLPIIERYSRLFPFKEIVPLSALTGDGVDELIAAALKLLPEGPRYFPEDELTDRPVRFLAAEMIREKVFQFTMAEVPYSVAVVVEKFAEKKGLVSIYAAINVERDSQKGIVIGKGGRMLKKIGTSAREDIERLLGVKVYLELFVKVTPDWSKDHKSLKEFGYSGGKD